MRTVQQGARVPARLSRTGVQLYTQADGSVLREYRPPSEVFAADSLKSFETATVTIGHVDVDPSNWKMLAVGFVLNPHKEDGRYVGADVVLQDAEALRRANLPRGDAQALVECSVGYDCSLEMTSGTSPDGEKYDAIQRQIVAQHVALGPADWARGGPAVKLKLDGGGAIARFDEAVSRAAAYSMLACDPELALFVANLRR